MRITHSLTTDSISRRAARRAARLVLTLVPALAGGQRRPEARRMPASSPQLFAAVLLVLGVLALSFAGWRVSARRAMAPPNGIQTSGQSHSQQAHSQQAHSSQEGLAAAINPDGSLRAGASGSFDTSGFSMALTATGAPRFVAAPPPMACSGWDTQFGLPNNGLNDNVRALAVSGTDIYVGGSFTLAGNAGANRVAKFDTLTGTWSALGTGGGNGLNDTVNALAVSGSDLYVGGFFTTANVGGTTLSANRVAKVNTTTGVWSALGTDGNGVNSTVRALALSGSDLYVGGASQRRT